MVFKNLALLMTFAIAAMAGAWMPMQAHAATIGDNADMGSFAVSTEQLGPDARVIIRMPWLQTTDTHAVFAQTGMLEKFLKEAFGQSWGRNVVCQAHQGKGSVFANLLGKDEQLVVAIKDRDDRFCNTLVAIQKTPTGLVVGRLSTWDVGDISKTTIIEGGATYVVGWQIWSTYGGARVCTASWPAIYTFKGGKFVDTGATVPEFYRTTEAQLTQKLTSGTTDSVYRPCLQMEVARIHRYLDPGDGGELKLAAEWASSSREDLRANAIIMLDDIGSPAARTFLVQLTQNADPATAEIARQVLATARLQ